MPGQFAHQHVLGMVGVLVFVNENVPEPSTVITRDIRECLQQRDRLADQIVEVKGVRGTQPSLIFGVDRRHGPGHLVRLIRHRGLGSG